MNRNTNSYFSHLPTLSFKRSRFKQQTVRRLQSQSHGTLTPFFIDIVYPGDTWHIDTNIFARGDISVKVPLDTIYTDIYYFYVPFRILDRDFEKILGGVDAYDTFTYSFPMIDIEYTQDYENCFLRPNNATEAPALWFLPFYLNYHINAHPTSDEYDEIMSYGPMAYYMIFNEFFRDENVDNFIPINDIKDSICNFDTTFKVGTDYDPDKIPVCLPLLQVNKYHDYFTSSILSPQKGPEVTLPLGLSAPIVAKGDLTLIGGPIELQNSAWVNSSASAVNKTAGINIPAASASGSTSIGSLGFATSSLDFSSSNTKPVNWNLKADLSKATAASINQFAIALKLEQLYQRRAIYGTRLTEIYRGQWGLDVPDDLIDRPEYLGGVKVDMNNIPVLNTTSTNQGQMVGNSATLFNDGGFTKSFMEYGVIIGLSATRVKHIYTQGVMRRLHDLKDGIDLYNPIFANLGPQAVLKREICNTFSLDSDSELVADKTSVFAYQEAWADLREGQSNTAGMFDAAYNGSNEYKTYWSYADYYSTAPTFSAAWLKESPSNVAKTMSGNLVQGASNVGCHQFLFDYQSHVTVYRELPARSHLSLFERY